MLINLRWIHHLSWKFERVEYRKIEGTTAWTLRYLSTLVASHGMVYQHANACANMQNTQETDANTEAGPRELSHPSAFAAVLHTCRANPMVTIAAARIKLGDWICQKTIETRPKQ